MTADCITVRRLPGGRAQGPGQVAWRVRVPARDVHDCVYARASVARVGAGATGNGGEQSWAGGCTGWVQWRGWARVGAGTRENGAGQSARYLIAHI